jgi:hypothetical protein
MMSTWGAAPTLTPATQLTHDLYVGEQQLRAAAEKQVRELRQLLRELAARFGAQALDDCLRADARALDKFTVADWRAFFAGLTPALESGWGGGRTPKPVVEESAMGALQTQLTTAQQHNAQLQQELAQLRQKLTQVCPKSKPAAVTPTVAAVPGKSTPVATCPSFTPVVATSPTPTLSWPALPTEWPTGWELHFREAVRPLALLQLWLIAAQGWPLFLEGRHWLTQRNPADRNRTSDVADELERNALVQCVRFPKLLPRDEEGQTTSVNAAELTPRGKGLCHALGWLVQPSELDVLRHAPLNERQVAGGLLFAAYARMRSHTVQVQADGLVLVDNQLTLLALDDAPPPDVLAWQRVYDQQGTLAFCAASPSRRVLHVAIAQAHGWRGQATDIQTLNTDKDTPLWVEIWP